MSGVIIELTPLSYGLICLCGDVIFLRLRWVVLGHPALDFPFVLWFGGTFPLLWIHRSIVSLLQFKFLLDFDNVSIDSAKRGDVLEFYLFLDVLVQVAMVFEYQMLP